MTDPGPVDSAALSVADTAALGRITERMRAALGLDIGLFKRDLMLARLDKRKRTLSLSSLDQYADRLAMSVGECERLGQALRPPAVPLFRDPRLFSGAFSLLGSWAAAPRSRIVWVPGCSTGEEVFAFALMSLKAGLTEVTVIGTDSDTSALSIAREGRLAPDARKGIPKVLQAWTRQDDEGDGVMRFAPEVMRRCQFVRQALLDPPPRLSVDLISCRGLLTTLDMQAQRQLLEYLHAALAPHGRLVVSDNEAGLMHRDLFVEVSVVEGELSGLFRRIERRQPGVHASRQAQPPVPIASEGALSALNSVFEMSREPAALLDAAGVIQSVNAAWRDRVQRLDDRRVGIDLLDLIDDRDPLGHLSDWLGHEPGSQTERLVRFRLKGGARDVRLCLRRAEGGAAAATLLLDTVESSLVQALDEQRQRSHFVGTLLREAVIITDKAGCIVEFSGAAERMTAWRADEALGQPVDRILLVIEGGGAHVDWFALGPLGDDRQSLHFESVSLVSREGRRLAVRVDASRFDWRGNGLSGAVFIVADITVNVLLAEELNYRSTHDALTGLLSREEFERRLSAMISEARSDHRQHAFAYLDLDQFKVINDTLGHFAGDELLRQFAGHLRALLSSQDVFARLGGDEFGVLMPEHDLKAAEQVMRKILEATRAFRFQWDGSQYGLTTSIGLTSISDQTASAAVALSEADAACFASKDAGRDRLHIAGASDEIIRRRGEMGMVSRINRALDLDRFELHYEDVVRCRDPGQVVYRELLVRMKDDEHPGQLISPGLFIPAAERYFLMGALDRWVVNKAFAGVARHAADGVLYAVNISGLSVNDDDFYAFVLDCMNRHGVAAEQICFELTETAAISHLKEARNFIERLTDVGFCFALDDFGVGMSSFSYLRNLPVSFLKIDGSFVRSMMQNPIDRGMVEAINRIGHEMNIKTIAEHVENIEVLGALNAMGVDYAQGWAISRGRPFDAMTPSA